MRAYIAKRILLFVPTVILVTMLLFVLMRLIPGDPALLVLIGDTGEGRYTQEQLDELRAELGTDRPIYVQYADWVVDAVRFDFGLSTYFRTPISEDLASKLPVSLELAVLAQLLAVIVAVPLGAFSALNHQKWGDYVARAITLVGVALPIFWTGILFILFLVRVFDWLPPLGYADLWDDPLKNLQQLIFPAIALAFYNMAYLARVTRSSLLEVVRADYVRTARAKGLGERVVIQRHALKNALLPVVTVAGWQFGFLVGGVVVIETIFLVPGMGGLLINSISRRDYTTIQAIVMVIALMVLSLNLLVDLIYGWLDPRIRYQ